MEKNPESYSERRLRDDVYAGDGWVSTIISWSLDLNCGHNLHMGIQNACASTLALPITGNKLVSTSKPSMCKLKI